MPDTMFGYVIMDEQGNFLRSDGSTWAYCKPEFAWIHPEGALKTRAQRHELVQLGALIAVAATYDPNKKRTVMILTEHTEITEDAFVLPHLQSQPQPA